MKKNRYWYALAFFLPLLVTNVICIANGVYPFGENCILHVDMYHQYCPFFTEFADKLQNGKSLMFSWRQGMGADFVALYAYYLASPLNWLLVLWPKSYVIEFMTLTILFKIALAGLCMYGYLNYRFRLEKKSERLHYLAVVFAAAYALSGFIAAYSWDVMWLDGVALAPLVFVGLMKLTGEKKPALYYVSLSVVILANYYIAMIICIFLVFYFLLLVAEQKEGRIQAFARFAWYSLLAGASAAILLIPEAIVLSYSGSSGIKLPDTMKWYFGFLQELSRSCTAASVYTGADHWPNLYAGAFSLILVILYAWNRKIRIRQKLPRLGMVVFLFISFSNNLLDFFWHGLHFPDSLPGRQSFLYIFVVLVLGFEALVHWKGISVIKIAVSSAIITGLLFAGSRLTEEKITDSFAFLITGLFIACYMILFILSKLVEQQKQHWVWGAICILAIAELVVNMAITGFYTTSRTTYFSNRADNLELLAQMEDKEKDSGAFYRVENVRRLTKNDSDLYGYNSATEFSSLMNINVSHLYQGLYMEGGKNYYCYNGATPLTSAMLSVKYVLSDSALEENAIRVKVAEAGGQYLYENKYWLPLGYMIPDRAMTSWNNSRRSDLRNLNHLAGALGAEEEMITDADFSQEVSEGKTILTPAEDGFYYAAYVKCDTDTLTASTEDGWKRKFSKTTHRYLLELGERKAGEPITIENSKSEEITFYLYRLNLEAVDQAYETLARDTLDVTEQTDTHIRGCVTASEDGTLILSIPYQEGWTIRVDDEIVQAEPYQEALFAIPLTTGTHEIELNYVTPGFLQGAVISAGSVLLFVLSLVIRGLAAKRQRSQRKEIEDESVTGILY